MSRPVAIGKTPISANDTHPYRQDHSVIYFLKSSLAGGVSGCFAKTVVAPLDRVKILFQGSRPDYVKHAGTPFGVFSALRQIYETQGIMGWYQGHSAMLLRIFPSAAIRFMAYEQYRMLITPTKETNTPFRHFIAGSLAGLFFSLTIITYFGFLINNYPYVTGNTAVLMTYPFEVIRSRLAYQIRHTSSKAHHHHLHYHHPQPHAYGIIPCIQMIYRENNNSLRGFYKGFGATMMGIVPYAGCAFMLYERFKTLFLDMPGAAYQDKDQPRLRVWSHLLAGGLAGMLGQTVSYPFDTIRHRMQLEGVAIGIPKYKHTMNAAKTILRMEGWRGFFVGLSITYWKTMPANAIAFVVYDRMKYVLNLN